MNQRDGTVDGEVLREWRRSRGWDAPELARRLRKAADGGPMPEPGSLKRMIWRWERHGMRNERYELLYAKALGIPPDDFAAGIGLGVMTGGGPGAVAEQPGPARPGGADGPVSSDQVPVGMDDVIRALLRAATAAGSAGGDVLDVDDVERRELLRLIGGLGLAAPFAGGGHADRIRRELDSSLNAPTTEADVTEWERVAAQYSAESGCVAPALLLPELLTDLDEAQARLKGSPDALRAPMARVCGYLSAITAVNLLNVGNERAARRYWRTALRTIDLSDDRPSRAMVYAIRASGALHEGGTSPAVALAVADEAVSIAGDAPIAGVARAHAARAEALAYLGDRRESVQAVRKVGEVFTRLPETMIAAPQDFGYSEQQVLFMESLVYAYAGDASGATRASAARRALVPDPTPGQSARSGVNEAVSLIQAGDPSEGARHIMRAVQALPAAYQRSSIIRSAAARALDAVPVGAASLPAVAEARELLALPPGAEA